MSVDLRPDGAGREDLVVRNEGSERYYVSLVASEILAPGTEQEARVEIADPEALGLLISPTRLILEPGASRAIRIVNIAEPGIVDRVYRLRITPQVNDVDAPPAAEGETGVRLRVMLAYDILVVSQPSEAAPKISATSEAGAVVLRNDGNTNALLLDGEICPNSAAKDGRSSCQTLADHRLYAHEVWKVETDLVDPIIRFKIRSSGGSEGQSTEIMTSK